MDTLLTVSKAYMLWQNILELPRIDSLLSMEPPVSLCYTSVLNSSCLTILQTLLFVGVIKVENRSIRPYLCEKGFCPRLWFIKIVDKPDLWLKKLKIWWPWFSEGVLSWRCIFLVLAQTNDWPKSKLRPCNFKTAEHQRSKKNKKVGREIRT